MSVSRSLARLPKKLPETAEVNLSFSTKHSQRKPVNATSFTITKTTKDKVPSLPFLLLKEKVLGKSYDLSLVIAGDQRARTLNERYRHKSYVPNVLSFTLDSHHGEIFLNVKQARRAHASREESYEYFVALLFIHGMLHLKGMAHGSTMERQEQKLLSTFNIKNTFRS